MTRALSSVGIAAERSFKRTIPKSAHGDGQRDLDGAPVLRQADCVVCVHGGLGLGLTIVRHLVELHEGTVKAESPGVGKGARFTVRIPRLKDAVIGRAGAGVGKVYFLLHPLDVIGRPLDDQLRIEALNGYSSGSAETLERLERFYQKTDPDRVGRHAAPPGGHGPEGR